MIVGVKEYSLDSRGRMLVYKRTLTQLEREVIVGIKEVDFEKINEAPGLGSCQVDEVGDLGRFGG